MDTIQLDTLDWVRLRCAACGEYVEILQLDHESTGGEKIASPCCGALLVAPDCESSKGDEVPDETHKRESEQSPAARKSIAPGRTPTSNAKPAHPSQSPHIAAVAPHADSDDTRAEVWRDHRRNSASVVTSVAVHAMLLALLAAIVLRIPPQSATDVLIVSFDTIPGQLSAGEPSQAETLDETVELSLSDVHDSVPPQPVAVEEVTARDDTLPAKPSSPNTSEGVTPNSRNGARPISRHVTANSGLGNRFANGTPDGEASGTATAATKTDAWSIPSGAGFPSRQPQHRRRIAALTGATAASEAAVQAGLKWLVAHQREDGSWTLQHTHAECGETCLPNSSMDCPTAATGLALLCFLGAGHSHTEGDYQQVVQRGIDWLVAQSREGDLRTSLSHEVPEGRSAMYAHGIAAMALCEAYGMTLDRTLIQPCEESIEFIAQAQDPVGGGWRYSPQEAGDTSVVGWQVMTLVSARLSGLRVPEEIRDRVIRFLRNVHLPSTGEFGYRGKGRGTVATTAIGSLCSLYLHSSLDRVGLQRLTRMLGTQDPKSSNEYANYYVSLVLHHLGGERWRVWNADCRDMIVATQVGHGHAAGSWDPTSKWGRSGGRLYSTCMNVLTLEVYYRHLPLYADDAFEIGLAARSVPKNRKSRPKTNRTAGKPGKQGDAPPSEFVPVSIDEPIAIPDGKAVVEMPQRPLTVEPPARPQSLFPRATRFSPPLKSLFDESALRTVKDGDGREWRLYPDAGFGMPLVKVDEQTLVQTGSDFGWYQPGELVFAAAAGVVRYSGGPATDSRPSIDKRKNGRDGSAAGWGNAIVIEHVLPDETPLTTVYAHLGDDRRVEAGDVVASGQLIASIGPQSETVNGGCVPHLFFAIRAGTPDAAETQLAPFASDTNGWLDPVAFLRKQQTDVLPAVFFSPTWNPFPRSNPDIIGQLARDWPSTEWLRSSSHGQNVSELRGKTICLVCVQASCEASRLLGGLLVSDLAERYENSPDVALVLLQTPSVEFKANSAATLRNGIEGFPENIAIGHVSAENGPPLILDWYGIRATPWTVLIGPDGTIAANGVMVDATEVGRLIDTLRQ